MSILLKSLDALLITNPTNIRYLTGFVGVDGNEREAYLLIIKTEAFLFTNSLYLEQARKLELLNCYIAKLLKTKLKIVETSREKPFVKRAVEILPLKGGTFKGVYSLGFEENDLRVSEFRKFNRELKGIKLVPTKNRIEELRMIKKDDEIENIRAACRLTDQCFTDLLGKIKPGVTESKIAWEIESFFRTRGASLAFSPIVAFGKNSSQPHYSFSRPGLAGQGLALRKNDIALLDFGARERGYCADMTRVVFVGKPKPEWRKAYQTVLDAQQAVLDKILHILIYEGNKPISGAELDRLTKGIIKRADFKPYPHSLGHNVGLDIHEMPRLTSKKDVKLVPGMVFSVEPGIYIDGQFGVRIEDLILLKDNGIEILTESDKKLLIL